MDNRMILLIFLSLASLSLFVFFLLTIHPFLSPSLPVKGELLIVEGWLPEYSLDQVRDVYKNGDYKYIVTVGGFDKTESGWQEQSTAEQAAIVLNKSGINKDHIISVPSGYSIIHRTLTSALILQEWLEKEKPGITSIDVFTVTVHARKSYILYKKVFEPEKKVGIIASETNVYDSKFWFLSGKGIYLVFRNIGGLFYALFVDKNSIPLSRSLQTHL